MVSALRTSSSPRGSFPQEVRTQGGHGKAAAALSGVRRSPGGGPRRSRHDGDELVALRVDLDLDVLVFGHGAGLVDLHADGAGLAAGQLGGRILVVVDEAAVHGHQHAAGLAVGEDLGAVPLGLALLVVGLGVVGVVGVVPDGSVGRDDQQAAAEAEFAGGGAAAPEADAQVIVALGHA